ncbi:MAG: carboxypeptidase regulatory-like domain-containing protein, partial [Chloracidobacterium sp.]|nr:carboxypeptidase regulatory-like domain-containing protein [Chloracidobacterium sp.]
MAWNRPVIQLLIFLAAFFPGTLALGQASNTGTVNIRVVDATGALIQDAQLQLTDRATNDQRTATTQQTGTYSFVNLAYGTYQLTVTKGGFQTQILQDVLVQTSRDTSITVTLKVGDTNEKIEVASAATPLVETESNALASTIDTKQVVNLPLNGRAMFSFAFLVPGYAGTGPLSQTGTFENMPGGAIQSADYDGTPALASRFRSSGFGYGTSAVSPRIENVAEMTISTGQLDLSGSGTSAMRINLVTRRGSNSYHGRVFEDFRNTALNANTWVNNARSVPTNILKLNDFGFSAGGPILKNRLFFFGTYAESIQPGSNNATANILSPGAQQGLFQYSDKGGALQTLDVLSLAGSAGAPSTVNASISNQLSKINGVLSQGRLTPTSDPNISTLTFQVPYRTTTYYPAMRFDYNATDNIRLNLSYSQTKNIGKGVNPPLFPGGIDPTDYTSSNFNNKIAGFGVDWVIRPTLINQFHFGYLYQYSIFDPENLDINLPSIVQTNFGYGTSLFGGAYPRQPISSLYSPMTFNDSLIWQKGSHSFTFGGGWYREHDIYWNGPGGYPGISFGITSQDPLVPTFTSALSNATTTQLNNAENLYAELTGRISQVNIAGGGSPLDPATKQYKPFGAYNLNEIQSSENFFFQDRWRFRPNLTINYGLRWDIVGNDQDVNGGYSSVTSLGDFWGPTPVGALFQPGNLGGVQNPTFTARRQVYKTSWVNPQPALAVAWSPETKGFLNSIFPKGKTVIRAGWSLRNYQEGAQNFWAWGSNQGLFFFQQGSLTSDTSGAPGTFQPGSLFLGQTLPPYLRTPAAWSPTVDASALSFGQNAFFGMNPNIRQPYVEQWNFGIQREIGDGAVIEARYVGNMSMHSWMSYNLNEVNIFENGFLTEFTHAQANLAINQANGKGLTFINNGLPGQFALPIFQTAFGADKSNYTKNITALQTGAAGSLAQTMARSIPFYCNMVGASFSPCAARGFTGAGAYPVNFWEVNPFTTGFTDNYLDASGHSNYHALQVELRQRLTHGMQFDLNYSLSKSLVLGPVNAYQANVGSQAGSLAGLYLTDRDFRLNYGPSGFDIRHIFHASGTYDLPFGAGRRFLNNGKVANAIVGGWTLGTIFIIQSGNPTQMSGGFLTVNQNDAGVVFNGITPSQLQSAVGVYHTTNPWVETVDPNKVSIISSGAVAPTLLAPASTAGVWGYRPIIYGPGWYNADLSLNKTFPIRESIRFTFQAQFLNIFNHPTFSLGSLSPQSLTFAQSTGGPTQPRRVEFRA